MGTWRVTVAALVAVTLGCWWSALGAEVAPQDVIVPIAPNVSNQFKADGRLTEAMWKTAVVVKDFRAPAAVGTPPPAAAAAAQAAHEPTVRLIQDRKALYVGVTCQGSVADKDEIVVALSPGIKGDAIPVEEVHFSPAGQCTVVRYGWGQARPAAVAATFPAGAAKTENGWSAEFAVSFDSFGGTFMSRDWLANFTCKTADGDYIWSLARKYDTGDRFGPLGFPVDGAEAAALAVPQYRNQTLNVKADGAIQPGEWDRITSKANLWPVDMVGKQLETTCRMMADAKDLFILIECHGATRPKKDGFQERLTFLLGANSALASVYRYEVGQLGVVLRCDHNADATGDTWQEGRSIQYGVWRSPDDSLWRLELKIPLACLNPEITTTPWRIQIIRKTVDEDLILAGYSEVETPSGFGVLTLGDPTAIQPGAEKELAVRLLAGEAKAPIIDGKDADACWTEAVPATDFQLSNDRMPPQPTALRAVRDATTLYLLVTCDQVDPTQPRWPQVTVLVAPPADNTRWCEIVASPDRKVQFSGKGAAARSAAGPPPDIKCVVNKAGSTMTFELAVPLDVLGPRTLDQSGRINVIRQTPKGSVWWSGDAAKSRVPAAFGLMRFEPAAQAAPPAKPVR